MAEFLIFLIGLCFGSFATVLVYRLNTDDKVAPFWQGRSLCPNCQHKLSWQDNIPLLSFILVKGHCRYCHKPIPLRYPIIELTTSILFLTIYFLVPNSIFIELLGYWFIGFIMLVIFFSDLYYQLIPDEMIIIGSLLVIARSITTKQSLFCTNGTDCFALLAMTGIGSAAFFFLIVLITKFRGMGLGDVKLAFLIGLLLGFPQALVAFWVSFIFGGIFALFLLALKKVSLSDTIALGPFLVLGTTVSALWSNQLLKLMGIL